MKTDKLENLFKKYRGAPREYQATSYWGAYETRIVDAIRSLDTSQLRSGKYPILSTFGIGDAVYMYHANMLLLKKLLLKFIHRYIINNRAILPYGLSVSNIQEIAYRHCKLMGDCTGSKPISNIEVSDFGNPHGIFEQENHKYTVQFLAYYIRYCFSNKYINYKGNEIIVELGSGSGYQIEILKKLYPEITVLCFDLPAQIYLCEEYLAHALGKEKIIGTDVTLEWDDLSGIKKGGIHHFGSWQFPLLRKFEFDVFWNAASFGEMEPSVVENYLENVKGNAKWVYLLQARHGKETSGKAHVNTPVALEDYEKLLSGYVLQEEHDAWQAHRRLSESGGYFEAIWKRE